jgi:putative sigma-54 modulation protein
MVIQTQSVHFDADSKLLEFIEKKVSKLPHFYDRIISCDVTLKVEPHGQVQDKISEIKLSVPGTTLIAKENCKSFEEAIDLGVESLRRQLIKFKEKHSSEKEVSNRLQNL